MELAAGRVVVYQLDKDYEHRKYRGSQNVLNSEHEYYLDNPRPFSKGRQRRQAFAVASPMLTLET